MAIISEKELGEAQRSAWLKAMAALELRNFDYAISLLQTILKQEPQFLTGRQLLRRTEITKFKATKKSFFNLSTASVSVMKAQREIRKDAPRAIELLEKVLEDEPLNRQANLALKEAAVAAGWPEIGVLALETLLEESPRETKLLHELGALLHEMGRNDEEVEIYNRIIEIDPTDAEASRRGKDASARASMQSGGWTQAESYRDLIRDKEAAVSLEQQSRLTLSDESIDQQIAEAYARHEGDQANIDHARRLGALYEQKGDLTNAVAWFRYAAELTGNADTGLVRKVESLGMKKVEEEIAAHAAALEQMKAGAEGYAEHAAALEAARRQRDEAVIAEAQKRVERNPTDLQLRFELGEQLARAGRHREALPELQRARQNPNARLKAMNLLGQSYAELEMFDLAAKQLEDAAKEIIPMDLLKKEIIYNLGLVHERMGDTARSIACMKQIYEADYGYRDVAARVESSYARAPEAG